MKIVQSIFLSFTTWIMMALVNALLSAAFLVFCTNGYYSWWETMGLVFAFSLAFAAPGTFILWIIQLSNWDQPSLFRTWLKTGLVIAALSSIPLYLLPLDLILSQQFVLSFCIIIASLVSIMAHRPLLLAYTQNENTVNHA